MFSHAVLVCACVSMCQHVSVCVSMCQHVSVIPRDSTESMCKHVSANQKIICHSLPPNSITELCQAQEKLGLAKPDLPSKKPWLSYI